MFWRPLCEDRRCDEQAAGMQTRVTFYATQLKMGFRKFMRQGQPGGTAVDTRIRRIVYTCEARVRRCHSRLGGTRQDCCRWAQAAADPRQTQRRVVWEWLTVREKVQWPPKD